MMNKQSHLYSEIPLEQIQLLYEQTRKIRNPVTATLLSGGMFNTTYHVSCKEENLDTVLRLGPINRHLLMRFEENLMEAEEYVYRLCKEQGIVCSEVLVCDTSRKWIDRDFMIVTYIPSVALCNAGLTEEEKVPIYQEVGRLAKKMHRITNQTFGRVSEILAGLSFSSWYEYLLSELRDIGGRIVRDGGMKPEALEKAVSVLEKYQKWLDEIKVPQLVHTDLWEGNILLDKRENRKVAAIIDSDRAIFGDPDYDLSCPWMTNEVFLEGYEVAENAFHGEEFHAVKRRTRRELYQMIYHFLDAYVSLSEYNSQEGYQSHIKEAFAIMEKLEAL